MTGEEAFVISHDSWLWRYPVQQLSSRYRIGVTLNWGLRFLETVPVICFLDVVCKLGTQL